ncbi:Formyl transferase, C-terminal domain [Salinimicrobium catena]|uniref:Formyl transferase, C-terminal domain n=1 Tax=Salinimicrobium catena TaxID=390640 RepID=A0A1H5PDY2_9FLAO|nr:formyltransferase family protein [Salinimicrobium catena]SDL81126.1 Formyl transferase, C-terminal domain [Salinimicrobium catena]SEF12129.1 Formyl transferase, C-terminal domain [Salinimicrobium catena]
MNKKIVLLGHGVGVKFTIESLLENSTLGYEVGGVITHPKEEHTHDLQMMENRKEIYGDHAYNVFKVVEDYNIPLLESRDVNSQEAVKWIESINPGYIISIGCRNIIKQPFLEKFKKKVFNIHTTPLPKYRGAASDSWMILNGEWGKKLYGCVHFIDTGIDTGNIIAKSYYKIPDLCYPIDLFKIRMNTFKSLLPETIKALQDPSFKGLKQNMEDATTFPRLSTPVDGIINWNFSGEDLIRFIHAFGYPHEGACCYLEGKKINILEAEFVNTIKLHPHAKGLIFGKNSLGMYKVALKDGYLLVKKIEVNGKSTQQNKIFRLGKFLK